MKTPSPLLGFNNNVRHKGRVFHIQTEDSGVKHPHIITHLFADGGRILKTVKTSYAEHVGTENMGDTVRRMMQEQHKAMFTALRDGQFDSVIDGAAGAERPVTGQHAARPLVGSLLVNVPPAPASSPSPSAEAIAPAAPAAAPQPPASPAPVPEAAAAAPAPPSPAPEPVRPAPPLPIRKPTPPPLTRPSADFEIKAMPERELGDRAAIRAQSSFFQPIQEELPPPPEAVLPRRTPSSVRPVAPLPQPAFEPSSAGLSPSGRPRQASSLMSSRPAEGVSIFGEDLISEKSLDEVILSYLADDLDAPAESNKK